MDKLYSVPKPTCTLDAGFYQEAAAEKQPSASYLAARDPAPEEFVDHCERLFYQRSGLQPATFSHAAVNPVREWAEARAALSSQITWFEKQTNRSLITVQDFYTDTSITSLFPAWIESEIQAALIATGLVSQLVFATEAAQSSKVTVLYDSTPSRERELRKILEGAELPRCSLTLADSTIYLYKYGRAIDASYEAIAGQRVDALAAHLRKIAQQVAIDETDAALSTLVGGDGTTAGAAESNSTDYDVAGAGTITYADLVGWYLTIDPPYQMDTAVCGDTDLALIANLSEFKTDSYSNFGTPFVSCPGPKALKFHRWTGSVTGSSYLDRMVVGIDSRNALKAYSWGGFLQEQDQIITRQVREWTFSYWKGFRKWDTAATQVLDVNTVL